MSQPPPPSGWTTAEQLVLVEAVARLGTGATADFTGIGKLVKGAMTYPGAIKRDQEFFNPRKCETKWREILQADDARRGAAARQSRGGRESTQADRASDLIERLRDMRKAEIKATIARINADIADIDRGIDPGGPGSSRAQEQELPTAVPKGAEPAPAAVVKDEREKRRATGVDTPVAASAAKEEVEEIDEEVAAEGVEDLPPATIKKRNELMQKIFKQINSHDKADPFRKPVTKREAPDYHTIIKKPMALNDVKKKVDKSEYNGNVREFMSDMNLIFGNAMQYNQKGSDIWDWAKELKDELKKQETTVLGDILGGGDAQSAAPPARAPLAAGNKRKSLEMAATPASVDEEEEEAPRAPAARGRARGKVEEEEEETAPAGRGSARSRRVPGNPRETNRKRRRDDD